MEEPIGSTIPIVVDDKGIEEFPTLPEWIMPSYQTLSQEGDGNLVQEILNGEATIQGYKVSSYRVAFFHVCNILTLGIPMLLFRWYADWKVKFQCYPSPLRYADRLILTDDIGNHFVCKVKTDSVEFLPNEFVSHRRRLVHQNSKSLLCSAINSGPILRHFTFRHEKFVWDDRQEIFKKIHGLDDVSCQQLLENFTGLSHSKRLQMRSIYGMNSIDVDVKSYWKLLIEEVLNPFYVFQILSVLLWCFDEYVYYATCVVIISAISISVSLVETKRQSEMLRDMAQGSENNLITVRRCDGEEEEISSRDLVPGDVILIPPEGFTMPCDGVLIYGTCIVNESMLTGESIPVQKSAVMSSPDVFDPESHKRHTLFCGTQIIQTRFYSGNKVSCVVVRTGYNTLKGQLIRSILFPKEIGFKFYADAMKFVAILFCLATGGMAFCIYLYVQRNTAWYVTLIRVLDIVTIVVPPALPAAMTVGTVYAQSRLKKKKIFCISPPRINFGGKLKLICFDKTGTLTEEGLDLWCVVPVEKNENDSHNFGEAIGNPTELSIDSPLLRAMASCHSLTYISGKMVGDPLDLKMFDATGWELDEPTTGGGDTSKFDLLTPSVVKKGDLEVGIIREFEFTSQLQRMSVIVRTLDSPNMIVYSKGAPEKIRPLCTSGVPHNFDKVLDSFTVKGYRVLAMASKVVKDVRWHQIQRVQRDKMEKDLEFCGFLVMQNSLKPATIPVIDELISASLRCVMVTGDNMLTALSVARECGIIPSCDKVIIVSANDDNKLEYTLAAQHYEENNVKDVVAVMNNNMNRRRSSAYAVVVDTLESTELLEHSAEDMGAISLIDEEDEEDPAIHMERLIPISGKSITETVLQMQDTNYHFVMNGRTWSLLEEIATSEEMEQIISKGTVYARMSPENKSQLVQALQDIGYVVGMCGDGANDCSALKMAHVGISLSEAEASVAAPFTSKIPDISCVPNLIREGRCALVTSFAIFKYMALYSMVQFASVLLLYYHATNLADTQFLYIDLGITTTIAVMMGRTEPFQRLVSKRPMGSLVSFQNVFSIVIQVLISASIQIAAMAYLQNQPWFVPLTPASPDDLITQCWETTTIFSVSSFQYLILALVFSKGPPFRKPFYTNRMFVICYVILTVFTVLLVGYPAGFLANFFYLEPIESKTIFFRFTLLSFPVINVAISMMFEHEWTSLLVKRFGRLFIKKKQKSRYKEIICNLENNYSWPPVKNT